MVTMISTAQQIGAAWPPSRVVRRLVLDFGFLEISSLESHMSHCQVNNLRSIINLGKKCTPSRGVLSQLLSCKLLTVLDLRGIELECIPKEVFTLFHLRHLGLSGKKITDIPKSIKKLPNLEYLYLKDTNVGKLPMEIQKLKKLRSLALYKVFSNYTRGHLGLRGFKAPRGMKELVELQELHAIDLAQSDDTGIVSEIGKLAKLRVLCITSLRRKDGMELCSSLEKLNSLRSLCVASSVEGGEAISMDLDHPISALSLQSLCRLELFGHIEKFPSWVKNLQGLETFRLSLSKLSEDPLQHIQHLPNLHHVHFTQTYLGESLSFKAGGFLKLKSLTLGSMRALNFLRIDKGAMPAINHLALEHLPLLEDLPLGIEHLSQLQRLDLWEMSSELIDKLENAGDSDEETEDYLHKIAHIPRVAIGFLIDGRLKTHWLPRKKKFQVPYELLHPQNDACDVPETGHGCGTTIDPQNNQMDHELLFALLLLLVCVVHVTVSSLFHKAFVALLSLLFLAFYISFVRIHSC